MTDGRAHSDTQAPELGRQLRQAEEALGRSLAQQEAVLASALDCIVTMDREGRITEFNAAAERTFGHRREDVIGRLLSEVIVPQRLRAAHVRGMERFLSSGEHRVMGRRLEMPALHADGSEFPVELAITCTWLDDEQPFFTGYLRGISERRRAEDRQAELFRPEQAPPRRAETSEERMAFLAEASVMLASSLDYEETLQHVADLAVPRLADWCAVTMRAADEVNADGSSEPSPDAPGEAVFQQVAVAHVDPEKVAWARELQRRYPPAPDAPHGSAHVIRTGEVGFYPEVPEGALEETAHDEEHLRLLRQVGFRSAMFVPMKAQGRVLGAITFVWSDPEKRYTQADLQLAEELARRAALEVSNARLYRHAEAARQRTTAILESINDAFYALDGTWRFTYVNRRAEEYWGKRREDLIGQNHWEVFPEVVSTQSYDELHRAMEEQRTVHFEVVSPVVDRWIEVSVYPASGGISVYWRDISEQKQAEEDLVEAKEHAEEMNRLKTAFLANMSHEIRTPLTGILGFASLLTERLSDKEHEYAQRIASGGRRLMDTLNAVLALSQLEAGQTRLQFEPLHVAEEAREAVGLMETQAQHKNLALALHVAPGAGETRAYLDRGALHSVLHNLISNALKFTEQGEITVMVEKSAQHVHVHVEDTGPGIDETFLAHLFDPFQQASKGWGRTHEGVGLGLAITKRLVERMQGAIAVRSEQGRGSRFTVRFPLAGAEEAASPGEASAPAAREEAATAQARLLVVEDNRSTQLLMRDILEELSAVAVAASAEEALEAVQDLQDAAKEEEEGEGGEAHVHFDALLVDINLGAGKSGADLLKELRARPEYEHVPCVAVTGYALPGDRERLLEMGFDAYLAKPFALQELLSVTARLLER